MQSVMNVPNRGGKPTVVIADDESLIRMGLSEILSEHGMHVVGEANDGFEAISLCEKHRPDVALLDIKMPMLDGLTAAKHITDNKLADTVVMVTAFDDRDFVQKANAAQVSGYVVKPVSARNLIPSIQVAQARSKDIAALRKKVAEVEDSLENRKIIERAKGLIMTNHHMTEPDAFMYLRNISKNKCIAIIDVAKMILAAYSNRSF